MRSEYGAGPHSTRHNSAVCILAGSGGTSRCPPLVQVKSSGNFPLCGSARGSRGVPFLCLPGVFAMAVVRKTPAAKRFAITGLLLPRHPERRAKVGDSNGGCARSSQRRERVYNHCDCARLESPAVAGNRSMTDRKRNGTREKGEDTNGGTKHDTNSGENIRDSRSASRELDSRLYGLTIGAMFVWVFFENLGKGLYTPGGYAGLINFYIQHGRAPAVWKAVMSLAASHASMAAPLQGFTEAALGVLLVLGLFTRPAALVAFGLLGSLWVSEWGTGWIWGAAGPHSGRACARNWERRPNLGCGCDSGSPKAVLTFVVIWLMRPGGNHA